MADQMCIIKITFTDGEVVTSSPQPENALNAVYSVLGQKETRVMVPMADGKSTYMAPGERIHSIIATLIDTEEA